MTKIVGVTGFGDTETDVLLGIRDNLIKGFELLGRHEAAGTFHVSKKEGSASPAVAGWLTMVFLLGIEDELETRIRGFERFLDLKLLEGDDSVQETDRDDRGRSSSSVDDHGGSGRVRSEEQQPRRRSKRVAQPEVHGAPRSDSSTAAAR